MAVVLTSTPSMRNPRSLHLSIAWQIHWELRSQGGRLEEVASVAVAPAQWLE